MEGKRMRLRNNIIKKLDMKAVQTELDGIFLLGEHNTSVSQAKLLLFRYTLAYFSKKNRHKWWLRL